jgi:predicted MFS family arabinose efflux permease
MTSCDRSWSLAVGGLLALAVAMGIGRFAYTPILPFMAEALSLTKSEAGVIASANFLGYLAGALLAATSWIKGSRRAWLVGALAASGLTTLLTAAFEGVPTLALMRFAGGLASAFVLVFASSVILERLAASGRSHLAALHFAGVGIGIALSAVIVSALAASGYGWQAQWVGTGVVALLAWPAVVALVPPDPVGGGAARTPGPVVFGLRLWALIASYGLFGFGYVITATFLVAIVRSSAEVRHLEGVVWILVGLAGVPSVALWTMLGRRIGIFAAYAAACIVEAAGVAASVLLPSTLGVVTAAAFLGGTFIGLTALGFVGARQLTASDPRRVLALMTVAFGLGQIIGPVVGGALSDRTGSFTLPSLLAAGALVVAAGLAGILELSARHLSAAQADGRRGGGR